MPAKKRSQEPKKAVTREMVDDVAAQVLDALCLGREYQLTDFYETDKADVTATIVRVLREHGAY